MKKTFVVAAIAAGALAATAPAAAAHDGDSYSGVNGDVLNCTGLPWNWEGFIDVLTLTGEYNACQTTGVTYGP